MMWLDGRRLARAALVGLAALLLTGTAVGFAAADDPAAAQSVVPAPRPGDRATYNVTQVILDPETAKGNVTGYDRITLEWMPARAVKDTHFGTRWALALRSTTYYALGAPYESIATRESFFDAETGEPLATSQNQTITYGDGTHYGVVLDDLLGSEVQLHLRTVWYDGQVGPCAMATAVQGAMAWPASIEASGCLWPGGARTSRYLDAGWDAEPDGSRSRIYESTDSNSSGLRLWFDGASPFPRRVETAMADALQPDYTWGRMFRLERVAFDRATTADTYADPTPGPGPAPLLPRQPWGPDDAGVLHPFPLSQAYAAALLEADPPVGAANHTTVGEWMASHPGSYVGFATYAHVVDRQGYTHPTWYLIFTDGPQWLAKTVESAPMGVDTVFLPPEAGRNVVIGDWTPSPAWIDSGHPQAFPFIQELPAVLPTVAGVMARYDAMALTESRPPSNAYGFIAKCWTDCQRVLVTAGRSASDQGGNAAAVLGEAVVERLDVSDAIWVDTAGLLAGQQHRVTENEAFFPVVPSAVGREPPASPDSGKAAAFRVPSSPAAAAGLGAAGLLLAALYYFWPAIKGLPFVAGFSRIEDDKVLQHPRRAQVMQLVQAEPGIHFQDMCRRLGLGRGTLEHHLRKMLAAGVLTKVQHGGYACFFPKGAVDRKVMQAAPVLRSAGGRKVFDAVKAQPGQSSRDIAGRLGLAPSTVSYHLKKLQEAGLVFGGGADGAVGVRLSPLGEQAAA